MLNHHYCGNTSPPPASYDFFFFGTLIKICLFPCLVCLLLDHSLKPSEDGRKIVLCSYNEDLFVTSLPLFLQHPNNDMESSA